MCTQARRREREPHSSTNGKAYDQHLPRFGAPLALTTESYCVFLVFPLGIPIYVERALQPDTKPRRRTPDRCGRVCGAPSSYLDPNRHIMGDTWEISELDLRRSLFKMKVPVSKHSSSRVWLGIHAVLHIIAYPWSCASQTSS